MYLCVLVFPFCRGAKKKNKIGKGESDYTCQRITHGVINPLSTFRAVISFGAGGVFIVERRKKYFLTCTHSSSLSFERVCMCVCIFLFTIRNKKKEKRRKKKSDGFSIHAPRSVEANFSRIKGHIYSLRARSFPFPPLDLFLSSKRKEWNGLLRGTNGPLKLLTLSGSIRLYIYKYIHIRVHTYVHAHIRKDCSDRQAQL